MLFKGAIRWKPAGVDHKHLSHAAVADSDQASHYAGLHKHFRMIAISESFANTGMSA